MTLSRLFVVLCTLLAHRVWGLISKQRVHTALTATTAGCQTFESVLVIEGGGRRSTKTNSPPAEKLGWRLRPEETFCFQANRRYGHLNATVKLGA
jgi:hypothetical protein